MSPLFINMFLYTGSSGGIPGDQMFALVIGLLLLGLFIDLQVINVFHRVGMKRALLIFTMEIIPVIIIMSFVLSLQFGTGMDMGPTGP